MSNWDKKNNTLFDNIDKLNQKISNQGLTSLIHDLAAKQYQHSRLLELIGETKENISDKEKQIQSFGDQNRILESKVKNLQEELENEQDVKSRLEKKNERP